MIFDVGANYGTFTEAAIKAGHKVIAIEPAPRVFSRLVSSYIYSPNVVPLKMAVSDTNNDLVEFYEADEDGLSSLNKEWLTSETMPYSGKPFRTIKATTITIDSLVELYGRPDLIKIDVEGAEWSVFRGMTKHQGTITFEWTYETLHEHRHQLKYLKNLGYTEVGPQFIENHLVEPDHWFSIDKFDLNTWVADNSDKWEDGDWLKSGLRPTADVGMCWVR